MTANKIAIEFTIIQYYQTKFTQNSNIDIAKEFKQNSNKIATEFTIIQYDQ